MKEKESEIKNQETLQTKDKIEIQLFQEDEQDGKEIPITHGLFGRDAQLLEWNTKWMAVPGEDNEKEIGCNLQSSQESWISWKKMARGIQKT